LNIKKNYTSVIVIFLNRCSFHILMKIAICGSGKVFDNIISKKTAEIGRQLAKCKCTVLTGACHGYPNEAAKAAFAEGGKVIGYSPARNRNDHIQDFNFPTENFSKIIYTAHGIPGRNLDLISNADAIIIVGGQVGTLNEFTIAMHEHKKIGILKGSGGVSDLIPQIADAIDKNGEKKRIIYDMEGNNLVLKLINRQSV
jgi:uncharacterized protein (TIGR00725 family)